MKSKIGKGKILPFGNIQGLTKSASGGQVSLKKSVTLVELIISIALLGIIVLGASAFHLASERFLSSSDKKTQVLNELTFILQHLHKNILTATGTVDSPGLVDSGSQLQITQPSGTVTYTFDVANNTISFEGENLTTKFVESAGYNFSFEAGPDVDGGVKITNLALRLDPDSPADSSSNPEVTTIDTGGNPTVYFYSLAHTWQ